MMTTDMRERPMRLNPFAFPSDTTFRFVLLIVFVLSGTVIMYGLLWSIFDEQGDKAVVTCGLHVLDRINFGGDSESIIEVLKSFTLCLEPTRPRMSVQAVGVTLLLCVASSIYWFFPEWKIRRGKLQALTDQDVPGVMACLMSMCAKAEIPPPVFVWNPLSLTGNALAFGRFGRYYVSLSGKLIKQFYTNRAAFQAVLWHELAHLRNADVDLTYFTVAIWQAFILTAVIPNLLGLLWHRPSAYALFFFALILVSLTATIYLSRNAILRVREFYADVRASVWDGASGGLASVLQASAPEMKIPWRDLFRMHPDPGHRFLVLTDTSLLFHMSFWEAFGAGFAATAAAGAVQTAVFSTSMIMTPELTMSRAVILVAATSIGLPLLFVTLAVGAVGIAVMRQTLSTALKKNLSRDAGRLGFALASGILFGLFLYWIPVALSEQSAELIFFRSNVILIALLITVAFGIVLLMISFFFTFRWVENAFSAWLEVILHRPSPRLAIYVILFASMIIVGLAYAALFSLLPMAANSIWESIQTPATSASSLRTMIALTGMFVLLATIGVWAVPLAAWFWQRRVCASGSSWLLLDGPASEDMLPHQAPFRPGLALAIGLIIGLIFWPLLLHRPVWEWLNSAHLISSSTYTAIAVPLIAAQMIAAAIAASLANRLGWAHGLLAAFVAGGVICGGVFRFDVPASMEDYFYTVVNFWGVGAFFSVPAAFGASFLAASIRHRTSIPIQQEMPVQRRYQ